jgi:hypothetical protein
MEISRWTVIIHEDAICDRNICVVPWLYAQSSERLDFRRVPELAAAGLASCRNEQSRAKSNSPGDYAVGKVLPRADSFIECFNRNLGRSNGPLQHSPVFNLDGF